MASISSVRINKQANDQFKKLTRTEDGRKGQTEYEVRADAITAKIARLKALRLARDAGTPAAPPAGVPVKQAGETKKRPTVSLSHWRKSRQAKGQQGG
jgi:hypothetical protein